MRKVELSVMKPWIAKKVIDLLGFEDDVVIEYVSGLLEDEANPVCRLKCIMGAFSLIIHAQGHRRQEDVHQAPWLPRHQDRPLHARDVGAAAFCTGIARQSASYIY